MNRDRVIELLGGLALLPFFPTENTTQVYKLLADQVEKFATDEAQVEWLVGRMLELFDKWPGALELRAVFCSRFKPKDGRSITSRAFGEDGIAKEQQEQQKRLAAAPLPDGHLFTADPEFEQSIKRIGPGKAFTKQHGKAKP